MNQRTLHAYLLLLPALVLLAAFTHFLEKRTTLFRTHGFHALDHLGREAMSILLPVTPE